MINLLPIASCNEFKHIQNNKLSIFGLMLHHATRVCVFIFTLLCKSRLGRAMVNLAQWILLHAHNGSQYGEMIVSASLPLLKHSFLPYFSLVGTFFPELSFPEKAHIAQGCVISSASHGAYQIQQATC